MIEDDAYGHQDVAERHQRHDHLRDVSDSFYAAKDDESQDANDNNTRHKFGHEKVCAKQAQFRNSAYRQVCRIANTVGLHARQEDAAGENCHDRENPRVPFLAHGFFNVVRGTTAVLAFIDLFVNLAKRRFDVCGCGAQKGDDPHPENRAGSAEANSCSHAGYVAGSDTSRQRNGQCLERRNAPLRFFARKQQADHLAKQANLNESCEYRIEQSCAEGEVDECLTPDNDVETADEVGYTIHLLKAGLWVLPENSLNPIDDYLHAIPLSSSFTRLAGC